MPPSSLFVGVPVLPPSMTVTTNPLVCPLCTPAGLPDVHFWQGGCREEASLLRRVRKRLKEEKVVRRAPSLGLYPMVLSIVEVLSRKSLSRS